MKLTKKKIKIRLITSFSVGIIAILIGTFLFKTIQKEETVLRKSFLWNEEVWKILSSNKRKSVSKPSPGKNKSPRVNGMIGLRSELDLQNYIVEVKSGEKVLKLPVSAFYAIPKVGYSTDFRCIEGWSEETQYAGAKFSDFMKFYDVGRKADGKYYSYVGFETPDGEYYVSLDMESMLHEQTVLAYEMNEQPLSLENGFPIRLIIPIKYGIKSLKRIGKIFFIDKRPRDYWAERGYDWYSGL